MADTKPVDFKTPGTVLLSKLDELHEQYEGRPDMQKLIDDVKGNNKLFNHIAKTLKLDDPEQLKKLEENDGAKLTELENKLNVYAGIAGRALGGEESPATIRDLQLRYDALAQKENSTDQYITDQKKSVAEQLYKKYEEYWNSGNPNEKNPKTFEEALRLRGVLGGTYRQGYGYVVDVPEKGTIRLGSLPSGDVVRDAGKTESSKGNDTQRTQEIGKITKFFQLDAPAQTAENRPGEASDKEKADKAAAFFQKRYNESAAGHLAGQVRGLQDVRGVRGAAGVNEYLDSPENRSVIDALESDPKNNKPRPNEEAAARHWFWNQKTGRPGSLSFDLFDHWRKNPNNEHIKALGHQELLKKLLGEREGAQRALKMPTDVESAAVEELRNKFNSEKLRNNPVELGNFRNEILGLLLKHKNSPAYNQLAESLNLSFKIAGRDAEPANLWKFDGNGSRIWPPGTGQFPEVEKQQLDALHTISNQLFYGSRNGDFSSLNDFLDFNNFKTYYEFANGNENRFGGDIKAKLYWDNICSLIKQNYEKLPVDLQTQVDVLHANFPNSGMK